MERMRCLIAPLGLTACTSHAMETARRRIGGGEITGIKPENDALTVHIHKRRKATSEARKRPGCKLPALHVAKRNGHDITFSYAAPPLRFSNVSFRPYPPAGCFTESRRKDKRS